MRDTRPARTARPSRAHRCPRSRKHRGRALVTPCTLKLYISCCADVVEVQREAFRWHRRGGGAATGIAMAAAASSRGNQHCGTCGKKMRVGPFKRHHEQFLSAPVLMCTVPADLRCPAAAPTASRPIRNFRREFVRTGDNAHPGGCSSTSSTSSGKRKSRKTARGLGFPRENWMCLISQL